jgi:hypothetical protein
LLRALYQGYDESSVGGVLITLALALAATLIVARASSYLVPADEHVDGRPSGLTPLARADGASVYSRGNSSMGEASIQSAGHLQVR